MATILFMGIVVVVAATIRKYFNPLNSAIVFTLLMNLVAFFIPNGGYGAALLATIPLSVIVGPGLYFIYKFFEPAKTYKQP